MDLYEDDWSPHKSDYHKKLAEKRRWYRRDRAKNPEKYAEQNRRQREANREYMRGYRRKQHGQEELIYHTPEWLAQEAQDVRDYPPVREADHVGCIMPGCEKPHGSRGVCGMHLTRFKRGDTSVVLLPSRQGQSSVYSMNPDYWQLFCRRAQERASHG